MVFILQVVNQPAMLSASALKQLLEICKIYFSRYAYVHACIYVHKLSYKLNTKSWRNTVNY